MAFFTGAKVAIHGNMLNCDTVTLNMFNKVTELLRKNEKYKKTRPFKKRVFFWVQRCLFSGEKVWEIHSSMTIGSREYWKAHVNMYIVATELLRNKEKYEKVDLSKSEFFCR